MTDTRHFAFGQNWRSFTRLVNDEKIEQSIGGLRRLFGDKIAGKPFLDIGCGSGLSMLAALRLGASRVVGFDIDADSVEATRALLSKHAPTGNWSVERKSVFDLDPKDGTFPNVYSWGVLHHTGNMNLAIGKAAALSTETLVIAIYRKTALCGAWKIEKRLYSAAPHAIQSVVRNAFSLALMTRQSIGGSSQGDRGMDWHHDIHDWLGGYPYESAPPEQIISQLEGLGFSARHVSSGPAGFGLFGTGCSEYIGITRDMKLRA